MRLRGLTVIRPWPWAFAWLGKRTENRSFAPAFPDGLVVALHAGKAWDSQAWEWIRSTFPCTEEQLDHLDDIPPGHIFALARIARVYTAKMSPTGSTWFSVSSALPADQVPWFSGPLGWLLADYVAIEPVACKGSQGLWPVPIELIPEIEKRRHVAQPGGSPLAW